MTEDYPLQPSEAERDDESLFDQGPFVVKTWQDDNDRILGPAVNDWAVMNAKTGRMECRRCGSSEELNLPMLLNQAADVMAGFARRHDECKEGDSDDQA